MHSIKTAFNRAQGDFILILNPSFSQQLQEELDKSSMMSYGISNAKHHFGGNRFEFIRTHCPTRPTV